VSSIEIIKGYENMNNLLTLNTGDKKMEEAYMKMQDHVSKCKNFDDFYMHFNYVVKTDDYEHLNKWLLKVLFVNMKYDKHDFDKLLDSVDDLKKQELRNWLSASLKKQGESI
jgi:hypothetical protein